MLGPVQGNGGNLNHQIIYPRPPNIPLNFSTRTTVLILYKLILKKIPPWGMRILLIVMITVLGIIIFFILLLMLLTCTLIKYYINITSVLGIWTLNFPILQNYAKLMGGCQHTREVYVHHWSKYLPKQYIVLTQYMLSLWWINFLTGLGQYLIQPGTVDQLMVMTTRLVDVGYTYSGYRLKKTPDIIFR